jgi:hypothetical protein
MGGGTADREIGTLICANYGSGDHGRSDIIIDTTGYSFLTIDNLSVASGTLSSSGELWCPIRTLAPRDDIYLYVYYGLESGKQTINLQGATKIRCSINFINNNSNCEVQMSNITLHK